MSLLALFAACAGLGASHLLGYTPLLVAVMYGLMSLATMLVYARDKSAARRGDQRVPENTLHVFALLGGWPGALLGQRLFHHKTRKTRFLVPFWITVVINTAALAWLHTRQGSIYLNTGTFALESLVIDMMGAGNTRTVLLYLLSFHA